MKCGKMFPAFSWSHICVFQTVQSDVERHAAGAVNQEVHLIWSICINYTRKHNSLFMTITLMSRDISKYTFTPTTSCDHCSIQNPSGFRCILVLQQPMLAIRADLKDRVVMFGDLVTSLSFYPDCVNVSVSYRLSTCSWKIAECGIKQQNQNYVGYQYTAALV